MNQKQLIMCILARESVQNKDRRKLVHTQMCVFVEAVNQSEPNANEKVHFSVGKYTKQGPAKISTRVNVGFH